MIQEFEISTLEDLNNAITWTASYQLMQDTGALDDTNTVDQLVYSFTWPTLKEAPALVTDASLDTVLFTLDAYRKGMQRKMPVHVRQVTFHLKGRGMKPPLHEPFTPLFEWLDAGAHGIFACKNHTPPAEGTWIIECPLGWVYAFRGRHLLFTSLDDLKWALPEGWQQRVVGRVLTSADAEEVER